MWRRRHASSRDTRRQEAHPYVPTVTPNPSVEARPNGGPPGPGWWPRGTFSPARAWRPTVCPTSPQTLERLSMSMLPKRWKLFAVLGVCLVALSYPLAYNFVSNSDAFAVSSQFLRTNPEVIRVAGPVQDLSLSWSGMQMSVSAAAAARNLRSTFVAQAVLLARTWNYRSGEFGRLPMRGSYPRIKPRYC